ncbi:MAG: hypothetical protein ACM3UZ_05205 [Acidobacteriota bacterium]
MKDMLVSLGYDVKTSDENDCMKLVRTYDPDILIANRTMNRLSGDMIIETVKTYKPETRGILSSCSPIRLEDYIEQKVDAVIQTPVDASELKKILISYHHPETASAVVAESKPIVYEADVKPPDSKPQIRPETTTGTQLTAPPPVKYVFCPFCGGKLIDVPGDFDFCPFCGHKLNAS